MDLIKSAEKLALDEIKKFGAPTLLHWEIANLKGSELAKKLKADGKLVSLGTMLMDVKLGQALSEGRIQDHVKMSVEAAQKFLEPFDLKKERKDKIINCVAAHHGTIPYICVEAEICANADCFRFLSPKGFVAFLLMLGKRDMDLSEALDYAEKKVEEKYKVISFDICKKETKGYYQLLRKLINSARSPI